MQKINALIPRAKPTREEIESLKEEEFVPLEKLKEELERLFA